LETTEMQRDYANAHVREAAEGVSAWERQDVVYVPERDGNLAAWQAAHLANGWTTQCPLEETGDRADPATRAIGRRYEMFRPKRVTIRG
jgi:hypothetical protein